MHDLKPLTALGGDAPVVDTIGTLTVAENATLALAFVAARLGQESECADRLADLLGVLVPLFGKSCAGDQISAFWIGPDQWMLTALMGDHFDFAVKVKGGMGATASVTEQTGGWVVFDVEGAGVPDLCERICAVPVRRMQPGDTQRTLIHQMGCIVQMRADDSVRIFGPRASAQSLHHALVTAAAALC